MPLRTPKLEVRETIAALALALALIPSAAHAQGRPWDVSREWVTFKAGYARSTVENAPNGNVGFGFGYSRMMSPIKVATVTLFKHFSIGAQIQRDVLGRYNDAVETETSITGELVRHFMIKDGFRPYLGLGTGAYFRKIQGTGEDVSDVVWGTHLTGGLEVPIDDRNIVGLDFRYAQIDALNPTDNPVFGPGDEDAYHWGLKLTYSIAY